ncbi:hypothetical protein [Ornithinimicrobium cavernae]|uniref:hypothetical protein n=1 Tax=Ornithinimicrobium cavernae TaxID=2666047 RepID=UPI000D685B82|nr:hypothetical protein [Ornithinimicrobium cavernae]
MTTIDITFRPAEPGWRVATASTPRNYYGGWEQQLPDRADHKAWSGCLRLAPVAGWVTEDGVKVPIGGDGRALPTSTRLRSAVLGVLGPGDPDPDLQDAIDTAMEWVVADDPYFTRSDGVDEAIAEQFADEDEARLLARAAEQRPVKPEVRKLLQRQTHEDLLALRAEVDRELLRVYHAVAHRGRVPAGPPAVSGGSGRG